MSLPVTDEISHIDTYMQALADITIQEDPFNITWPSFNFVDNDTSNDD
jgi:hypothetical protein